MQLLRFRESSCALAAAPQFKPFIISVPLMCRHSDRFRLFSVLTDSSSARPAGHMGPLSVKRGSKRSNAPNDGHLFL